MAQFSELGAFSFFNSTQLNSIQPGSESRATLRHDVALTPGVEVGDPRGEVGGVEVAVAIDIGQAWIGVEIEDIRRAGVGPVVVVRVCPDHGGVARDRNRDAESVDRRPVVGEELGDLIRAARLGMGWFLWV